VTVEERIAHTEYENRFLKDAVLQLMQTLEEVSYSRDLLVLALRDAMQQGYRDSRNSSQYVN
jgi:hypothetical protein